MKPIIFGLLIIQSIAFPATYQENVINVKSEEEIKIIPNSSSFDISIRSYNKKTDSAIIRIRPLIKSTESVFKKYGLDQNTAKITEMTVRPVYLERREGDKKSLLGYEAIRRYKITFNNMEKLSILLVELKLSGVDEIGNIEFTRIDKDSLGQVVLLKAIEKASKIAKEIAKKSDVQIGRPTIISNEPPEEFSNENRVRIDFDFGKGGIDDLLGGLWGGDSGLSKIEMDKIEALKELFKIDIGEIEIKNNVWVTFPIVSNNSKK